MSEIEITLSGLLLTPENEALVAAESSPDPAPSSRAEGNLDTTDFIHLLQDMLKVDMPKVILVPAFPKYLKLNTRENELTMDNPTEKFKPTITYHTRRREPATIGGNKQPFGTGQKDYTPRERMRIGNPDGTQSIIYGQNFDNLVRFNVFCLTNTEAEDLVNWFEQYLRTKRVFFRNMGLGEILFWLRDEDETVAGLDNRLERRTLTFYVRTEELSRTDEAVLKNLEIKLGIHRI